MATKRTIRAIVRYEDKSVYDVFEKEVTIRKDGSSKDLTDIIFLALAIKGKDKYVEIKEIIK